MNGIQIKPAGFGTAEAQQLIAELIADLVVRYGGDGDGTPTDAAEFAPPVGGFFVAYLGNEPVGCGGWRTWAGSADQPAVLVAEVKRVYTREAARGRGVARQLMAALEQDAKERGRSRMILETGTAQPEAIALYQALGYAPIPGFGHYKDEPEARSFGRDL